MKYIGERNGSRLIPDLAAEKLECQDSTCVTQNSAISAGAQYWEDGHGWRNGFLSITDSGDFHGNALHYTAGDGAGVYYTKWVEVQPNTDYALSFDVKILESGGGKLMVIDDAMSIPQVMLGFEFDQEIYGTDWNPYYLQFNTRAFTRIGIAVCDLGGEALLDNIRLFRVADGIQPGDANGDGRVNALDASAILIDIKNGKI